MDKTAVYPQEGNQPSIQSYMTFMNSVALGDIAEASINIDFSSLQSYDENFLKNLKQNLKSGNYQYGDITLKFSPLNDANNNQ
jgi:hypothetical protein